MLYFVRHGQSVWNAEGRVQGQAPGIELTTLGRQQARDAAAALAEALDGAPARIITSDLLRAEQTARLIGEHVGCRVETDQRLREQFLGDMEGQFARDLKSEPVPEGQHISEVAWGGGESLAQVWERAREVLREIARRTDPQVSVVIVSHETLIRAALAVLNHRTHRELDWSIRVSYGQVIGVPESEIG